MQYYEPLSVQVVVTMSVENLDSGLTQEQSSQPIANPGGEGVDPATSQSQTSSSQSSKPEVSKETDERNRL